MRHPCGDVPQPKSPGHRGNALNSRRGLEGCSGASGDARRSGRNCGGIGGRFGQIAANPNRNRRKIALPGQMRRKPADRATRFPRVGAGGEGPWGDVRACRGRGDGSGKAQRGIFPGLPHFCVRAAKKVMQNQGVFRLFVARLFPVPGCRRMTACIVSTCVTITDRWRKSGWWCRRAAGGSVRAPGGTRRSGPEPPECRDRPVPDEPGGVEVHSPTG